MAAKAILPCMFQPKAEQVVVNKDYISIWATTKRVLTDCHCCKQLENAGRSVHGDQVYATLQDVVTK